MSTPSALEERVTRLEYFAFEQLSPSLAATNMAVTQIHAKTVANGAAIAGVRLDMATMQAALALQGDSLREEIGVTAATIRSDITAFREATDQRFERAGMNMRIQLTELRGELAALVHGEVTGLRDEMTDLVHGEVTGLRGEMNERFATVDQRFDAVDQRFDELHAKIDTVIAEIRAGQATS